MVNYETAIQQLLKKHVSVLKESRFGAFYPSAVQKNLPMLNLHDIVVELSRMTDLVTMSGEILCPKCLGRVSYFDNEHANDFVGEKWDCICGNNFTSTVEDYQVFFKLNR